MAGLEEHFLCKATIFKCGWSDLGMGINLSMDFSTLQFFFSSETVWVSCGASLSGLAFL